MARARGGHPLRVAATGLAAIQLQAQSTAAFSVIPAEYAKNGYDWAVRKITKAFTPTTKLSEAMEETVRQAGRELSSNPAVSNHQCAGTNENAVNKWIRPEDVSFQADAASTVGNRCDGVEAMEADDRDDARDTLTLATMDNAFQTWLDDSKTNSEFNEKAEGEIGTMLTAVGAGLLLAMVTAVLYVCYCFQWCSACCRPKKRERGMATRKVKLGFLAAWGLVGFIIFVLCAVLLGSSVTMNDGFDTMWCRFTEFFNNMVSGSGGWGGIIPITVQTRTLHNRFSACQDQATDFLPGLNKMMTDTEGLDKAQGTTSSVTAALIKTFETMREEVWKKGLTCKICDDFLAENDKPTSTAWSSGLYSGVGNSALYKFKADLASNVGGAMFSAKQTIAYTAGSPAALTSLRGNGDASKESLKLSIGALCLAIGAIWLFMLLGGALAEGLFFFKDGANLTPGDMRSNSMSPVMPVDGGYDDDEDEGAVKHTYSDGTPRYTAKPARCASFMWCTTCWCAIVCLGCGGLLGVINFFTGSMCLQMDGMKGENFNDLSSKALGSNGLDPAGVKLWNECFAPGGGGDMLITMETRGCRRGDPQYNNATYPSTCADEEIASLTLKESIQTKIRGNIDASFQRTEAASNKKKDDGTPATGLQDEKSFRTLRPYMNLPFKAVVGQSDPTKIASGNLISSNANGKLLLYTGLDCNDATQASLESTWVGAGGNYTHASERWTSGSVLDVTLNGKIPGIQTAIDAATDLLDKTGTDVAAGAAPCGQQFGPKAPKTTSSADYVEAKTLLLAKKELQDMQWSYPAFVDAAGTACTIGSANFTAGDAGCVRNVTVDATNDYPWAVSWSLTTDTLDNFPLLSLGQQLNATVYAGDAEAQLLLPIINGNMKGYIEDKLTTPLGVLMDQLRCSFMGTLWEGIVDGFCFQTVTAMILSHSMLLGLGIMSWAYILIMYGIWRWVKDNIHVKERKLRKEGKGADDAIESAGGGNQAWEEEYY